MAVDRIRDAQQRLGRTVRRARLVEDRNLARAVRDLGERLAHINFGILQLLRLHDLSNRAFDRPLEEFATVLRCLNELLGPVTLIVVEDHVYVNDIRVRFEAIADHSGALHDLLRRHNIGGITYFQELTPDAARTVFSLLAAPPAAASPRSHLQRRLEEAGLTIVQLHPVFRFSSDEEPVSRDARQLFAATAQVLAEVFANTCAGRLPNPLPVRRLVNDLIDATRGRDLARLAFEADRSLPIFARHSLMVADLALVLGRGIGLSEPFLADLGVAALLHDIGYCGSPGQRRPAFSEHTRRGLQVLLRQRGFHEGRIRRLLVMAEHHQPFARPSGPPTLPARIVHVADDYDSLTRHRPDGNAAAVPADALRLMAGASGTAYDPTLVQLLANSLGAYPPGSVLRLGDGTVAQALSGVRSPETFAAPHCRVMRLPGGGTPDRELWVDLAKGGQVLEVVGSRLLRPEPPPEPPPPRPPPPRPTFGSTNLRMPKPAPKRDG